MDIKSKVKTLITKLLDHRPKIFTSIIVNQISKSDLLKCRCALITGGTSGIGFAIAKAYIDAGAYVVITGRNEQRIENALRQLNSDKVIGFVLDQTKIETFTDALLELEAELKDKKFPIIDILVNNAGVNGKGMPNATEEEFNKIIDTNLKGVFFLSQMFGKYFIRNCIKGNILNIASASSLRPADSAYSVTKWGIRGLTLGLAKSLASEGITVNGIAPGPTATPMMVRDNSSNMYLDRIPLKRYIMPEEIANMAVFLVSSMGKSIMGELVYMTGGAGNLTYDDVKYGF